MATVNQNILKKFRKATIRQQGDGDEAKVEVREDEEQSIKLQEIIDLLVAAGYFRARIKALSAFDKVVGGITWCIDSCNVDIDVDLLFQENSTIGQKISLTEKIVAVLQKMKCSHKIEPHQIQGLDFIHIFPVVQWLVKKSMEFRKDHAEFVRLYAVNQFNKTFNVEKSKNKKGNQEVLENLDKVYEAYKPRRFYKRKTLLPDDVTSRVQITLLEYGMYGFRSYGSRKSNENDDQNHELQIQHLLSNMAISNEIPSDFNLLNDQERKELFKHYTELQFEIGIGTESKEKQLIEEQINRLSTDNDSLINEEKLIESELNEIKLKQSEAVKKLNELECAVEELNAGNAKEIEELVRVNDNLRQKELQFKEECKKELVQLQNKIEEMKSSNLTTENESSLAEELQQEMEKMKNLRLHLAKKNRVISVLQRQMDESPSRPELAQYQRRYFELYNQIAAKHKETKQYFTLFNTLEDTKQYMKKELSLLNSISDSYPEAMMSNVGREEFLRQLDKIVEGVKQSKCRIELNLVEEKQKRDQLGAKLQGLVELQRKYVAAVRQLSIECKKFEVLNRS
nr:coiled-coil domain-containing protein 93 isoform X1 [Onthophagus taurus]